MFRNRMFAEIPKPNVDNVAHQAAMNSITDGNLPLVFLWEQSRAIKQSNGRVPDHPGAVQTTHF
jgi:hypothetical protein